MSEEVASPAEAVNVYDLTTQVDAPEGAYLVGYAAIVKLLTDDGRLLTRFVAQDMNNFEIVGLFTTHLDVIRQENVLDMYPSSDEDEEEE